MVIYMYIIKYNIGHIIIKEQLTIRYNIQTTISCFAQTPMKHLHYKSSIKSEHIKLTELKTKERINNIRILEITCF